MISSAPAFAQDGPAPPVGLFTTGDDPGLIALSPVLAETVAHRVRESGRTAFLVRRQTRYLLLGPQDQRLPRIDRGLAWAAAEGLTVYVRISGGTAVLLDGDCLSFGMAAPCRDFSHIRRNYDELTRPVRLALDRLGVRAAFGAAHGAYCEGPYDLLTHGRKVAGVAQALRQGVALVSGMILVGQDPDRVTAALNRFYAAADPQRAASGWHLVAGPLTNLSIELGRTPSLDELEAALFSAVADLYPAHRQNLSTKDLALARQLLAKRRVATAADFTS